LFLYSYSKSQLQLAETMGDFSLIGLDNQGADKNEDLKTYLTFIPAASTYSLGGLAGLNFQGGLDAVSSIKKSFKKLRHNTKKAYKKAMKKARKEEAKRIAKINAENTRRRRAYYQRLANQRAEEARAEAQRKAYTHYDQYGNGYSSQYNNYYSDRVINPSNIITRSSWFNYGQTTSSKFSWKSLLGTTAYASTTKSVYKPKKSWWGKVRDWGNKKFQEFKQNLLKTTLNITWNIAKWIPPIVAGRGVVAGGKWWYDSYKGKDTFDRVHQVVNTVSATSAVTSLTLAGTGVGIIPAAVTTAVGSISDLISAGMYAFKGEWGAAGLMAFGAIPVVGDIAQVAKLAKGGAKGIKLATAVAKVSKEERKFAEWFAKAAYEKNWKTMISYKGFERITDYKFIENTLGIGEELLKDSRSVIFYNKKTGKAIISSAGTRLTKLGDWVEDLKNVVGLKTKQYEAASKIAKMIKEESSTKKFLAVIGHSMGGGKAKVIGLANDIKTYTFNTAFTHSRWLNNAVGESIDFMKTGEVLNYLQTGSLFKKLFPKQFGQTIKYGDDIYDALPGYTLRARVLKLVYGIGRHGIN